MNLPITTIEHHDWEATTSRIFDEVGVKIRETRRVLHILRFVLCGLAICAIVIIYWIAMINA